MYVISVDSYYDPYILPETFETPEDAIAMCDKLAQAKERIIVNDLGQEAMSLKSNRTAVLFTRNQHGKVSNYRFIVAEVATPVAKEPVTGRFIIDIDGDKIVKSNLAEVKAWLDGFLWANDAVDEKDCLAIGLNLDKEFTIPTEDSNLWFFLDTIDMDDTVMSVEITWEAIHE